MFVADDFDSSCLNDDDIVEKKAQLEIDQEYSNLAKDYWMFHGQNWNLYEDDIWISADSWMRFKKMKKENPYTMGIRERRARFSLEGDWYEIWKNLEENREKYEKHANRFL